MSRSIRIAPESYKDIYQEFLQSLRTTRASDGKITFTKKFDDLKRKAMIYFSEGAWLKMSSLISSFDDEVAWHALAYRDEDESKDNYYITDILVYPQTVTGATVTTDQDEYENWLNELDDETFNHLRMQGHSHVNMGVTPSATDNSLYDGILDGLRDDDFYIFMIWNKKGSKTIMVYDYKKNVLFETSDCTVEVIDGEYGLSAFAEDAKKKVVKKTYVTPTYHGGYRGGYQGSYQSTYQKENKTSTSSAKTTKPATAVTSAKKENSSEKKKTGSEDESKDKKTGKRKGKRKESSKVRNFREYADYGYEDYGYGY